MSPITLLPQKTRLNTTHFRANEAADPRPQGPNGEHQEQMAAFRYMRFYPISKHQTKTSNNRFSGSITLL